MTQPNKDDINAIMSAIEDIFKTIRNNTFTKQKDQHFNDKTSTNSKPWFNYHCRQARKKYHLARRIYSINKTHPNQEELLATSRNYKREINKSITNYKRMMKNKMRQMKQKSHKDFWNYVSSLNKKPSNSF